MDKMQITPTIVSDVKCWLLFKKKENEYCLGSLSTNNFIKLYEYQIEDVNKMIYLMDGNNTLEFIDKQIKSFQVKNLFDVMCSIGLIQGYESQKKKNEFELYSFTFFKIPLYKMNKFLCALSSKIINRKILIIISMIMLIICIVFFKNIPYLMTSPTTYKLLDSDILNIILYYLLTIVSVLLHELSHALVASRYNIYPTYFSGALYLYISPIVYLTIPGIYTRQPKERIYVWGAGMYTNLLVSMISLLLFSLNNNNLAALIFVINITLVMVNLSPMMPLDGYFIVCTLLRETNMRRQFLHPFDKNVWSNSSILIKLYTFSSFLLIISVLLTQCIWLFKFISSAYEHNTDVISFFIDIKLVILVILVMIISRVIKLGAKKYGSFDV
ncbi:M50 family metallopeptidase [Vagococcus hydrophili]|uniref:M50 family metallopeptidase n=1 Tax=Vagococcus hydrophili TaxID=2714947 RepID=A0A6G8AUU4_9ENTE|nr:M50 family metallopeptidase [Vagococcus hydrophili]QIL48739.1 M50 family metallopeptidase [Vagococcus hydrophili]